MSTAPPPRNNGNGIPGWFVQLNRWTLTLLIPFAISGVIWALNLNTQIAKLQIQLEILSRVSVDITDIQSKFVEHIMADNPHPSRVREIDAKLARLQEDVREIEARIDMRPKP